MPLVRKWNMFENNVCMCVCMYVITKRFCSRSLVCSKKVHFPLLHDPNDRLCGLVVRVSGYRYRGLGFDSRRYQIF